jgi:hypothetical protein
MSFFLIDKVEQEALAGYQICMRRKSRAGGFELAAIFSWGEIASLGRIPQCVPE